MKKILHNRIFSLMRLALFAGVLMAIVFSNGEGISLLPFSHSGSDKEFSFKKLGEKQIDAYIFSVHGLGKLRSSSVSKHQKNLRAVSLNSFFSGFSPSNVLQNDILFQGQNFDRNKLSALSGIQSKPSDRAPPAI